MTAGDQGGDAGPSPDPQRPPAAPQAPGSAGPPAGYGPPPGYGLQPWQPYGATGGVPPDNYLVWAILSTILCCLPLGVVSIVFAAQVNDKWRAGDVAGALESARRARQFAIWSAVATVLGLVLLVLFYLGLFAALVGLSSVP